MVFKSRIRPVLPISVANRSLSFVLIGVLKKVIAVFNRTFLPTYPGTAGAMARINNGATTAGRVLSRFRFNPAPGRRGISIFCDPRLIIIAGPVPLQKGLLRC